MSKVFNMVGGGGGKNISSIIITGLESTDTVTCTKDGKSYTATWDETAQHWEIVGLPFGTFTITATRGTNTTTETVFIDIAGVYEIEMNIVVYLIKNGDLESTFSVFSFTGDFTPSVRYSTLEKQSEGDVARFSFGITNSTATAILCKVDITNYDKLIVDDVIYNCTEYSNNVLRIGLVFAETVSNIYSNLPDSFIGGRNDSASKVPYAIGIYYTNSETGEVSAGSYEYDVSGLSGEYYIGFGAQANNYYNRSGYMQVKNIYLK